MEEKTRGRLALAVAVMGFIIIVLNAAEYLLAWDADMPSMMIGIVFVVLGMYMSKK